MKITTRVAEFDWISALIAAPFAVVLWWLFSSAIDRESPVTYIQSRAVEPAVRAGEQETIEFTIDRKRTCRVVSIYRYIRDRFGVDHAVANYTVAPNPREGFNVFDRLITVPDGVPAGPAAYYIKIAYACNIIHELGWPIVVHSPEARFTVLPSLEKSSQLGATASIGLERLRGRSGALVCLFRPE
ncbi:MAG TPA: hypothetical protein VGV39_14980 [Mesorhizobium sp.]|jgi:hypothetical protein|uniref:hypothetical protein n=1 Tax=Mesorhizobium sp. TaxID=1871066 RepID=UPI002DDD1D10|nr:hypothetical protein [Mesorhizobium sp.]HEV2504380.1 hypothetical protein [Mesorhizobium sp.]